jgi:tRNA 2-thiouridine synthesizing protein B
MLHIVNRSPFERNSFESCLRMAQPGSTLLLIEDAVVAATRGTATETQLAKLQGSIRVCVLGPDLDARGLRGRLVAGAEVVDYDGFVDLVTSTPVSQSWL